MPMQENISSPSLPEKIGQMLLVGFRGCEIKTGDPVARDTAERNLGGVIFFDQEMADTNLQGRNVKSPEQLKSLVDSLHDFAQTPLLVSIDQEGGRVNRLKAAYGFPETISHEELGSRVGQPDTFPVRQGGGAHDAQNAVAPDPDTSLAQCGDLGVGQLEVTVKVR